MRHYQSHALASPAQPSAGSGGSAVVLACTGAVLLGLLSTALVSLVVHVPLLLRQMLHADVAARAFPFLLGGTGLVLLRGIPLRGLPIPQPRAATRRAGGVAADARRGATGTAPLDRIRLLVRCLAVVGGALVVVAIAAAEALVVDLLVS